MKVKLIIAALIMPTASAQSSPLVANNFAKYPGYSGSINASGSVYIGQASASQVQVVFADLHGVDPACTAPQDGTGNKCGIHVHDGEECDDAGGHYYAGKTDPWIPAVYLTDSAKAKVENMNIKTDLDLLQSPRVFVIHDSVGNRAACAKLVRETVGEKVVHLKQFSQYPGYDGRLSISGQVEVYQIGTSAQSLFYKLEGVDPNCKYSSKVTAKNGCGLHIHEGSCDLAGGHHWRDKRLVDPWLPIRYVADSGTSTGTTVRVNTGFDKAGVLGRSIVVHDHGGNRAACADLEGVSNAPVFADLSPVSADFSGAQQVKGYVRIGQLSEGVQTVFARLDGVDSACTGEQTGESSKCGIHLHEGTSCDSVGGHFWNTPDDDPWLPITYTNPTGPTVRITVSDVVVQTGLHIRELPGRVVVVYDSTGVKVACAQLGTDQGEVRLRSEQFQKYPGYSGDLATTGTVELLSNGESQSLRFDLQGADTACTPGVDLTGINNGCGIHIHSGTTCEKATLGHHWDKSKISEDPWVHITYRGTLTSGATVNLYTAYKLPQFYGRVVVVHDKNGARVACGRLLLPEKPPLVASGFAEYPNYSGSVKPSGSVNIGQPGNAVQVVFADLEEVDPNCSGSQDGTGNKCGIHIHAGESCDAAGGHLFAGNSDPWLHSVYSADSENAAKVENVNVATGYDLEKVAGRAFVIHDQSDGVGNRAACAVLNRVPVASTLVHLSGLKPYPPYEVTSVSGQVAVYQHGTSAQSITYNLIGVDSRCALLQTVVAKNGCGLHIHESSCKAAGDHHWKNKKSADPWLPIRYLVPPRSAYNNSIGTTIQVETGLDEVDVRGRSVVVHDFEGKRVACADLEGESNAPSFTNLSPMQTSAFEEYPGYQGTLNVSGSVWMGQLSDGVQTVWASLHGVDPACTGDQTGQGNKCGIHVHEGTSCASAAGHFWNAPGTDPWVPVTYTDPAGDDNDVAVSNVVVQTGLHISEFSGRVFVVHDATGARAACATLMETSSVLTSFQVQGFRKYPDYSGDLAVVGRLDFLYADKNTQNLRFQFEGADPACTPDVDLTGITNGCGIHIHSGTSCEEPTQGHHWDKTSNTTDPWAQITYRTASPSGVTANVNTGLELPQINGRVVVVHDKTGKRIACGRLLLPENPPLSATSFAKYPGYPGSIAPIKGRVKIGQSGNDVQVVSAELTGVDPHCVAPQTGTGNKCGIHVHAGISCDNAGGHLYGGSTDPWVPAVYLADENGSATVQNLNVKTDLKLGSIVGRAFVIHDTADGVINRAACAIVELQPVNVTITHIQDFSRYPGYAGSLNVSGQVAIYQEGNSAQSIHYRLQNLDKQCSFVANVTANNGCGIHIHEGSCDNAGGHHWKDKGAVADPWLPIRYVATGAGFGSGTTPQVETQLGEKDVFGRSVVVHDFEGKRVACANVEGNNNITPAPTPAPTSAPTPVVTTTQKKKSRPAWHVVVTVIVILVVLGSCGACMLMPSGTEYKPQKDSNDSNDVEMQEA